MKRERVSWNIGEKKKGRIQHTTQPYKERVSQEKGARGRLEQGVFLIHFSSLFLSLSLSLSLSLTHSLPLLSLSLPKILPYLFNHVINLCLFTTVFPSHVYFSVEGRVTFLKALSPLPVHFYFPCFYDILIKFTQLLISASYSYLDISWSRVVSGPDSQKGRWNQWKEDQCEI